ncbi:putative cystinosin, lysosomal cystine transporter [Trypoxylus dichotomus]
MIRNMLAVLVILVIPVMCGARCTTKFSEESFTMLMNEERNTTLIISDCSSIENITIQAQHENKVKMSPSVLQIGSNASTPTTAEIAVKAFEAGETNLFTEFSATSSDHVPTFVKVQVYKNQVVEILSMIIGWSYFLCWTISMYPQVYENYKRKSVVGFNFDSVVINITGYALYSTFSIGLYYIPAIRDEYQTRNPFSIIAVLPNDVFFAVHGLVLSVIKGIQCLWYDRGGQTLSWFSKWFHYIAITILIISAVLSSTKYMLWLDFLYICSYIKLAVTFCKYGPQAIMNYKRQSTEGWSIDAVLLDSIGGIFSVLQMFMNAYNYNEKLAWVLQNPAKLWLGIFSLLFDLLFVIQHYCLYNKKRKNRRQISSDIGMEATLPVEECLKLQEEEKVHTEKENSLDCQRTINL